MKELRSTRILKGTRKSSSEKVLPTAAIRTDDDDPPEIEEQETTSVTRVFKAVVLRDCLKKSLKSPREEEPNTAVTRSYDNHLSTAIRTNDSDSPENEAEQETTPNTAVTRSYDNHLSTAIRTNDADLPEIEAEQETTCVTRVFKAVVLEDFLKKSLKSTSEKKPNTAVTSTYDNDDSNDDLSDIEEGNITRTTHISSTLISDHCPNSSYTRCYRRSRPHSVRTKESIIQNDKKHEEDDGKSTHDARPEKLTDKSAANKLSLKNAFVSLPRLALGAIKISNRHDGFIEEQRKMNMTQYINPIETMSSSRPIMLRDIGLKGKIMNCKHGDLSAALSTNARLNNPIVVLKRLELENSSSPSVYQAMKKWDSESPSKKNGCTNNWKMRVQFAPKTKVKCSARK